MSNKGKRTKEKIMTAADLASANNRNDDSLSFISAGQLAAEEKRNDHKVRIVATKDGKVWLQPANGSSNIDLTQTALSNAQINDVNSIPQIQSTLENEVLVKLEEHLQLINERSTVEVNNIQDQRLEKLEDNLPRIDELEDNLVRITTLENSIMNIPTTSIRTTEISQGLSVAGTGTLGTNSQLSTVLTNISSNIRNIRTEFPRTTTTTFTHTRAGNVTTWTNSTPAFSTNFGNSNRLIGVYFTFMPGSDASEGRKATLFIPRNAANGVYQLHIWPSNITTVAQRQAIVDFDFEWTANGLRHRFRNPSRQLTHNSNVGHSNNGYNHTITIIGRYIWTNTLGNT